jgi:hypothetical protein
MSMLVRIAGLSNVDGGGVILWIDFLHDSSTWAFLEWEGARCGTAGTSGIDSVAIMTGPGRTFLESKKDLERSTAGVIGVAGDDDPSTEESSLLELRKLLSMVEKSESFAELIESPEDVEVEIDLMSGAVNAWTLVVEMSSVGSEIISLLMVPGAYLEVPDLVGVDASSRFMRLVKALANDIVKNVEIIVVWRQESGQIQSSWIAVLRLYSNARVTALGAVRILFNSGLGVVTG